MSAHVFADETKAHGYLMAAAIVLPDDLTHLRKQVGALRLQGQRGIHFKKERDSRRRMIIGTLGDSGVSVMLYDASAYAIERIARRACLEQLVDDLASIGARKLVIDRDDSLTDNDRQVLYNRVRVAGNEHALSYEHMHRHEEALLAIHGARYAKPGSPTVRTATGLTSAS